MARSPASFDRLRNPDAREMKESSLALLFIAPTLLIVGIVFVYPVLYSFWLSLNRYNLDASPNPTFAGFHNYSLIFTNNFYRNAVLQTTWRTTIFTVISVPIELGLGLAFALL